MPRGRRQAGGPSQSIGGGSDAVLLAADRVLSKENDYRAGVRRIQAAALILADRISIRGDVEAAVLPSSNDNDGGGGRNSRHEAEAFLKDQREKLKALCDGNGGRMRGIDDFLRAVGEVRDEVVHMNGGAVEGETNENDAGATDYERSILEKIETYRERREKGLDDDEETFDRDEEFGREVRKRLGEKEVKKRKRGSRAGGDDDDEELEVLQNQDASGLSLKCPITGMLYEDPVKNKLCGHTYSRAGLRQLLHTRGKKNCPIPGCANNQLSNDQVEDDVEMEMKVRRHIRREQERERLSQEEAEDEDNEEVIGNGMTVIE